MPQKKISDPIRNSNGKFASNKNDESKITTRLRKNKGSSFKNELMESMNTESLGEDIDTHVDELSTFSESTCLDDCSSI